MNKKRKIENIEFQTSSAEVFLDATNFFSKCGVHFINSKRDHRYGLSILIDDSLKCPTIISPFSFAMSRNALAGLYVVMIKGERLGGSRRILALIKVINEIIKDGYKYGSFISYNIETGKHCIPSAKVLSIFFGIVDRALSYSLGGKEIEHLGDIYSLLGGYNGTKAFFKEVFLATEASIPNIDDPINDPIIGYIPDIKCYTCKHCKCDEKCVRTCSKVCTSISGADYDAHPGRYVDAHHSEENVLMSSIIDERMDTCDDYEPRIK